MESWPHKLIIMTVQVCTSVRTWDSALSTNVVDSPLGPTLEWLRTHLALLSFAARIIELPDIFLQDPSKRNQGCASWQVEVLQQQKNLMNLLMLSDHNTTLKDFTTLLLQGILNVCNINVSAEKALELWVQESDHLENLHNYCRDFRDSVKLLRSCDI